MTGALPLCLFGAGAVFAALCGLLRRGRPLWALLGAVCTQSGVLAGLALGSALSELVTPVLLVCAVSMASLLYGKGDGA